MAPQIIGLTTPLMAMVFVFTFLLLWWRGGMGRYVLAFAASYFFFALGFSATHLMAEESPFTFHVTQAFYTLGTVCVLWGAAERIHQRLFFGPIMLTYAVAAAVLAVAVVVSDDIAPRLYIVNTGYGVMFAGGALTLMHSRRRELFDVLVIWLFVASSINFFVRPVLTLLVEGSIATGDYRESIYYSVLNVALAIMSLVTAITLIGACVSDLVSSMRETSARDLLTGLRNRRAFENDLATMLDKAKVADVPVSLVVADIDHFKQVNDLWGHLAGDQAIAGFGKLIDGTVRSCDITGRIGGEEFCILVWNCDETEATRLAERIRVAFAQTKHESISSNIHLTASFGVTQWTGKESYRRLFGRADALLYRAKDGGRNRVEATNMPADHEPPAPAIAPTQLQERRAKAG